jgi:hypothetical protein
MLGVSAVDGGGLVAQDADPAVALWEAPSWACSQFVDEGAIEHRRRVGEVVPNEHEDTVFVDVVQRDELNLIAESISITRASAEVTFAGIRFSEAKARDLARLLAAAVDVIEDDNASAAGTG